MNSKGVGAPIEQDIPVYLSLKQVAEALGVTDETVRKYRMTQGLPVKRIGGVLRAEKSAFIKWCNERPSV